MIVGLNSIFLPSLRSNGLSQSSSFQLRHVFCHLSRTTPPPSCMLRRLFLLHAKKPNFITSQSITLSSMIQVHLKNLKKKPTSLKILFKVVLCRDFIQNLEQHPCSSVKYNLFVFLGLCTKVYFPWRGCAHS